MAAPSGALRADLGAHVPAAWALSVRYNGSVDSSEEWELNVASRLASRVPRPREAAVAVGEYAMVAMRFPGLETLPHTT